MRIYLKGTNVKPLETTCVDNTLYAITISDTYTNVCLYIKKIQYLKNSDTKHGVRGSDVAASPGSD